MGRAERKVATYSEYLLYALLLAQPLVGWAMLSAADSPITILGPLHLPGIAPHGIALYAFLRTTTPCWLICCSPRSRPTSAPSHSTPSGCGTDC